MVISWSMSFYVHHFYLILIHYYIVDCYTPSRRTPYTPLLNMYLVSKLYIVGEAVKTPFCAPSHC